MGTAVYFSVLGQYAHYLPLMILVCCIPTENRRIQW